MTRASRILVVEDDQTLRETLGEVMTDDGHEVRLARDGREALELLSEWEADLLILDLMMPRMDAYRFREVQLRDGVAPDARVLVLSAVPDLDAAARQLEADAWVAKPFLLQPMLDVINDLLKQRPQPRLNT